MGNSIDASHFAVIHAHNSMREIFQAHIVRNHDHRDILANIQIDPTLEQARHDTWLVRCTDGSLLGSEGGSEERIVQLLGIVEGKEKEMTQLGFLPVV